MLLTFVAFTWRGLTMFYSGDDMMNMWKAWTINPWRLGRAVLLPWEPVYRPLGGIVYRFFYQIFGFHPFPLYAFCYLLLLVNFLLAWRFFRAVALSAGAALIALSLTFVHGRFLDLYVSAGTIYDRLVFFFTVGAVCAYAEWRRSDRGITFGRGVTIWLLCLLAMDSKESGVVAPALLLLYEVMFVARDRIKQIGGARWVRELAPLAVAVAALGIAFVFGRVERTPDLVMTPDYHTKLTAAVLLERLGHYLTTLGYDHVAFSAVSAGALLAAMLLVASVAFARGRKALLFGWFFFTLSILPVASIAPRLGYVLYVPLAGLGLWAAGALEWILRGRREFAVAVIVALGSIGFHWMNRTVFPDSRNLPEYRLTEQFRREHPRMNPFTKILFASDDFPSAAFDLKFNLELLYGVPMDVRRMRAPADQQPIAGQPMVFDYIFAAEDGRYVELDNRNPAESIRLHILRHYSAGRHLSILNRDHGAYLVSGVIDGEIDNPGRWTREKAILKFDVYPADSRLTLHYFVADQTAAEKATLSVAVNGNPVGTAALDKTGMKDVTFPVASKWISKAGYTLVELSVDKPIRDGANQPLGVVLGGADFDYAQPAGGK